MFHRNSGWSGWQGVNYFTFEYPHPKLWSLTSGFMAIYYFWCDNFHNLFIGYINNSGRLYILIGKFTDQWESSLKLQTYNSNFKNNNYTLTKATGYVTELIWMTMLSLYTVSHFCHCLATKTFVLSRLHNHCLLLQHTEALQIIFTLLKSITKKKQSMQADN